MKGRCTISIYAQAADKHYFNSVPISDTVPTKLITDAKPLRFRPEKGMWVKADPANVNTIFVAESDVAEDEGWPLVKGEEMLFDIIQVEKLFAIASANNDVLHVFIR